MVTVDTESTFVPSATPLPAGSATPLAAPSPNDSRNGPESAIPAALHGRWGMVPADCTSTRGDAKGLLRVAATTLTFYESAGRLGAVKERSDSSLRADYTFNGEGMTWKRDVALTATNGGKTLTRLDRGGDEPGGPFTYTKCQP